MANHNVKSLSFTSGSDTYTIKQSESIYYAVCESGATVANKAVSIPDVTELEAGLNLRIKFTNSQNYNGIPKIKINNLSAVSIVRSDSTASGKDEWEAGQVLDFVYDGVNFVRSSSGINPNDIINNLTTTTTGKVLDASQGKVLKDMIDAVVASTLRTIPFSIPVASWTLVSGYYTATVASVYITTTSKELVTYDGSLRTAFKGDMNVEKTSGGGSMTFTTNELPAGTVNGTIYCVDSDDGRVNIVLQETVVPIEGGGTGAQTAAGARTNLGAASQADMTTAQGDISDLGTELSNVESGLAYREDGTTASRNISKDEFVFWQGVMYRASTDIASGETFEVGTNLTAKTAVLNELNELNDHLANLHKLIKKTESVTTLNNYGSVSVTAPTNGIFVSAHIEHENYWVRHYIGGGFGIANYNLDNEPANTPHTLTHYWLIPVTDSVPIGWDIA